MACFSHIIVHGGGGGSCSGSSCSIAGSHGITNEFGKESIHGLTFFDRHVRKE
jgi:hypothetical protein